MPSPSELFQAHLDQRRSNERRVLGYYQRLNMSGLDFKGQASTAYSELGYGGSVNAGLDIGNMLVPFCHAEVSVSGKGERPAHALLVLQRMAQRVWATPVTLPAPDVGKFDYGTKGQGDLISPLAHLSKTSAPIWITDKPVALAHLDGVTERVASDIALKAWAGLTDNYATDETGLSIGAGIAAHGESATTLLVDREVRHFGPSPYASGLVDYVDDIVVRNLKRKAIAWLAKVSAPRKQLTEAEQKAADKLDRKRHKPIKDAVDEYYGAVSAIAGKVEGKTDGEIMAILKEKAEIYENPTWDDVIPQAIPKGFLASFILTLNEVKNVALNWYKTGRVNAKELKKKIEDHKADIESFIKELDQHWDDPLTVNALGRDLMVEVREDKKHEVAEANELLDAMKRLPGFQNDLTDPPAPTPGQKFRRPLCFLNLHVTQSWCKVDGGAKVKLPFKLLSAQKAKISRAGSKTVAFRFQNFAKGRTGAGGDVTLVTTQDTRINYNLRLIENVTDASVRNFKFKRNDPNSKQLVGGRETKKTESWTAMTYQSALATWFHSGQEDGTVDALPNGSGLSFGMSVLADRFQAYAAECRDLEVKKSHNPFAPPPLPGAVLAPAVEPKPSDLATEESRELEAIMVRTLRVRIDELRSFMASAVDLVGQDASEGATAKERHDLAKTMVHSKKSVIVEANLGTTAPLPLNLHNGDLQKLSDVSEFNRVEDGGARGILKLRAIRLRYRIAANEDNSRTLIAMGWNVEPATLSEGKNPFADEDKEAEDRSIFLKLFGVDPKLPRFAKWKALTPNLGFSVKRVKRVGSEGMFDLHVKHFPDPFDPNGLRSYRAKTLNDRFRTDIEEISVSPTVLFSQ